MKKHFLAVLAYMLPTFPLGYLWHLTIFAEYYKSLQVYRENVILIHYLIISPLIAAVYRHKG